MCNDHGFKYMEKYKETKGMEKTVKILCSKW